LFDKSDEVYLKKLNVSSILDLALVLPHSIDSTYISDTLDFNSENVLDISVKSINQSPKVLKILAYAYNIDQNVTLVFFNYRAFHFGIYKPKNRLFIKGKVEQNLSHINVIQPKVINEINKIELRYKRPLQNRVVIKLIKKYITSKNLNFLPQNIMQTILQVHNPLSIKNDKFDSGDIYTFKYIELYNYMQKLSTKKIDFKAITSLNNSCNEFIKSLPFSLTDDQNSALSDIKSDLSKPIASKRVIMGDVGSGKTILILASVVIAYPNRAVLMAPTTILANQIKDEADKLLPSFIKVKLVTNKSKKIDLDNFDFIIGTHALLYRELPKFALVMIDEQHRFGTAQRQLLEYISNIDGKRPHFLQFTATPIPRTLAMIESSFVKFSFLKQTPFKKDIETKMIHPSDFTQLIKHIKSEIYKSNQIIIVYPLVNESDNIDYQSLEQSRDYWESNFKNVYVTHGKDKEKESILDSFKDKGNILLSTTVIEVGISLPRLSTIVIVAAERLGLASLHQLRGRVSRNGLKGYCYLFTRSKNYQRLEEFSLTNDGFEIAELDLKYRDSGDLLSGKEQSGKQFEWIDLALDKDIIYKVKQDLITR